ncbi:MAG: bifunctional nicotinamidase/pyrazinamidase [Chitinivibrionales bacterium]|nr:bifunctional nicotinamidase/pyrazinamidase [Chitinivibrionales bacterium]
MGHTPALLIVDVQNDFCPGGAVPVPQGDLVVPVMNNYIELFLSNRLPVFASRDWHPAQTEHFETGGGSWPPHCIQNTWGAQFHPDLEISDETTVVSKGMEAGSDGYSAFESVGGNGKPLAELLSERDVDTLMVGGLATDYCVKASVLEALDHGYEVYLQVDATRGVELHDGDVARALDEMHARGAKDITFVRAIEHITAGTPVE